MGLSHGAKHEGDSGRALEPGALPNHVGPTIREALYLRSEDEPRTGGRTALVRATAPPSLSPACLVQAAARCEAPDSH